MKKKFGEYLSGEKQDMSLQNDGRNAMIIHGYN